MTSKAFWTSVLNNEVKILDRCKIVGYDTSSLGELIDYENLMKNNLSSSVKVYFCFQKKKKTTKSKSMFV